MRRRGADRDLRRERVIDWIDDRHRVRGDRRGSRLAARARQQQCAAAEKAAANIHQPDTSGFIATLPVIDTPAGAAAAAATDGATVTSTTPTATTTPVTATADTSTTPGG